jgi:hypothetical protein
MVGYDWGDLVDDEDKIRTLNDPTNAYAQSASMAMGRVFDDLLIAAALGSANTGEAGGTSTALPSAQKIASASADMTLAKLRTAKRILDGNDVDEEDRYIVYGSQQLEALLSDTTLTSGDYNTVLAMVKGEIDFFMGFKFIRSERLNKSGNDRQCFAFQKQSLLLAVGKDVTGKITERADKRYSMYVYYKIHAGATRMDETGVVQIDCDESA